MFHASQRLSRSLSPEQYRDTNTDPYHVAAADTAEAGGGYTSAGVDQSVCGGAVSHAVESDDSDDNSDTGPCCSSASAGVDNNDGSSSSSEASPGVDSGSEASAGDSKGMEINIVFPTAPIVHLAPFYACVEVLGVCNLKLKIIVTPQNEVLFMASQWLGAAIGCSNSKSNGDKLRDLMKRIPYLRAGSNDLYLISMSTEVTKITT